VNPSRRNALTAFGGAALAASPLASLAARAASMVSQGAAPGRSSPTSGTPPVSGRVLPGLKAVDDEVLPILEAHSMAGAAIAIAQQGKLKVARGYGFANVQTNEPMLPRTPFLLASCSKVPTAQTALRWVDEGRISLTDRVFEHFRELRPPEGRREDPRLGEITVEMCLWHTGGWNRKRTPFPGPQQVKRALRLEREPTPDDLIRFMKGVPLDFAPGTEQAYSNFGFVLVGAMMASIARQPYGEIVQSTTLRPMGITGMRLDPPNPEYLPGETHRYTAPANHAIPGGHPAMTMAAGGWMADCIDMARLLTGISGSRTGAPFLSPRMMQAMVSPSPRIPVEPGKPWFGLGWDEVQSFPTDGGGQRYGYAKEGDLPGIYTWIEHLAIDVDLAILVNTSGEGAKAALKPRLLEFIRGVRQWPDGDLFAELPGGAAQGRE